MPATDADETSCYPDGFPSEYSIIATFTMPEDIPQNIQNWWQVNDSEGNTRIVIHLLGDKITLEVPRAASLDNTLIIRTFANIGQIFNSYWHKLALSVRDSDNVKLWVPVLVTEEEYIYGNQYPSHEKRSMDDSPVLGLMGIKGEKGLRGPYGDQGNVGMKGMKGKEGDKVGDPGPQGPKGRMGHPGLPGNIGSQGQPEEQGVHGDDGLPEKPGSAGPVGPRFPPAHVIEVCKRIILEQISTFANRVRRQCASASLLNGNLPMGPTGPTGLPAPPGTKGKAGLSGIDGESGPEGLHGEPGDPGHKGPKGYHGEKGDKGDRGYGIIGLEEDPGPRGEHGRGGFAIDGLPGQPGPPGYHGQPGLGGSPGSRGTPGLYKRVFDTGLSNSVNQESVHKL